MVNWIEAIPECPVCRTSFIKLTPMVLPNCGHTLCEGCLRKIIEESDQTQPKCPTCKVRFHDAKKNFMLLQWIQNLDPEMLSKQSPEVNAFKFPESLNVPKEILKTANDHLNEPMQKIKYQQETLKQVEAQVEKIQKSFDQEAAKIQVQFKKLKLSFNRIIQAVQIEKVQKLSLTKQLQQIKQAVIIQQFKVNKNKRKYKSHLNSLHKLTSEELTILANQSYVPAQVIQGELGNLQQLENQIQENLGSRVDNIKLKQLEKSNSIDLLNETITSLCDFQFDTGTSEVLERFERLISKISFKVKINPVKIITSEPEKRRESKGNEKFQQALEKCSIQELGFQNSPKIKQVPQVFEEDSIEIRVDLNSQQEMQIGTKSGSEVKRKYLSANKQDSKMLFPNEKSASKSVNQSPQKSQRSLKKLKNTVGTPVKSFKDSSQWCHNEFIFFMLSEQQLVFNLSETKISEKKFQTENSIQIVRPNTRQSIIQTSLSACQVSSNEWFATGASPSDNCYSLKSEHNEFTLKRLNLTCKPRTCHRLIYMNEHVFCIGGNVSGKPSRFVEKLQLGPQHFLWQNCQQIPKPVSNFGLTTLNDTCILLVGSGPSNCLFASVYDTVSDSWVQTIDLQQPSLNVQSIWTHQIDSNRTLILITPKSNSYGAFNDFTRDPTKVLILKLSEDFKPLLQPICILKENRQLCSNAVVVDNKLFVFGGNLRHTCETIDDIESINPESRYVDFAGVRIRSPLTSLIGIFKDYEDSIN